MLTGRVVSGEEPAEWGLVARVVPHESLIDSAREILAQCCRTAPAARGVVKSSLDSYLGLYDRIGMKSSLRAPEAAQGFRAFKDRRSPRVCLLNGVPTGCRRRVRRGPVGDSEFVVASGQPAPLFEQCE